MPPALGPPRSRRWPASTCRSRPAAGRSSSSTAAPGSGLPPRHRHRPAPWFRPEGGGFIAGISPDEADDPDGLPLEVDHGQFADRLWPALAARVPAFDAIRLTSAWAGYYESTRSITTPHRGAPRRSGTCSSPNGFSGHGIQQSPAVGRAIAELIVHGRYVTIDLAVFGFERIAAGRPVIERNVIG